MNFTDLEKKVKGLDLNKLLPTINSTNDLNKILMERSLLINELLSAYTESKTYFNEFSNSDLERILMIFDSETYNGQTRKSDRIF